MTLQHIQRNYHLRRNSILSRPVFDHDNDEQVNSRITEVVADLAERERTREGESREAEARSCSMLNNTNGGDGGVHSDDDDGGNGGGDGYIDER